MLRFTLTINDPETLTAAPAIRADRLAALLRETAARLQQITPEDDREAPISLRYDTPDVGIWRLAHEDDAPAPAPVFLVEEITEWGSDGIEIPGRVLGVFSTFETADAARETAAESAAASGLTVRDRNETAEGEYEIDHRVSERRPAAVPFDLRCACGAVGLSDEAAAATGPGALAGDRTRYQCNNCGSPMQPIPVAVRS